MSLCLRHGESSLLVGNPKDASAAGKVPGMASKTAEGSQTGLAHKKIVGQAVPAPRLLALLVASADCAGYFAR
jgi:hypothetical protein